LKHLAQTQCRAQIVRAMSAEKHGHFLLERLSHFTGPTWEQEDDITLVTLQRVQNVARFTSFAADMLAPESMTGSANAGDAPLVAAGDDSWETVVEFSMPSEHGKERAAVDRVQEALQPLGLSPPTVERLGTAVAEATMNAMEHGNHYQSGLPVAIHNEDQELAALDLPVWVHPMRGPNFADYASEQASQAEIWFSFGWPYETTACMTRLIYSGIFDELPNLKIITHHMGGMIPYFAARIAAFAETSAEEYARLGLGESGPRLSGAPLDHFRRFYNDCISNGSPDSLRMALDFFGPDHLMFGTDFPFGPDEGERWPLDELRNLRTVPLDEAVREKILYRNAQTLLKLPAGATRS